MINWFHRFLNPHCPHCKEENDESKVCASCETLRSQLERLTFENDRLLSKLIDKPSEVQIQQPIEVTKPRMIPWKLRQQMLESEDRERAKLMKDAPKPSTGTSSSIEDLEKELGVSSS